MELAFGFLAVSVERAGVLSPHRVFLIYSVILLGILVVAGVIIAVLGLGLGRDMRAIWQIYASWCVLGPLTFATIYFGPMPTILLFLLFAALGFREFARGTGLLRDRWITAAGYVAIGATAATCIAQISDFDRRIWKSLFMEMPAYSVILFLLVCIVRNRAHEKVKFVAMASLGFILVGWMFLHVALLASRAEAMGCLLFLLLAIELCDVAAYTVGRLFGRGGKHALRSQISPKKTWEGAFGAFAAGMALPWILRFSFPFFGPVQLVECGIIVGVGGQLGDLAMSVIKRDMGLKDMGGLIPGHGGVLDRIDSLIFCAPLFQHMVSAYLTC